MTIKSSGSQLAFSEIETEFGANGTRSLGSYRLTQSVGTLSNLPLDTGVPTSGTIKFSDFYGKQLNIVVDCFFFVFTCFWLYIYIYRRYIFFEAKNWILPTTYGYASPDL